MKAQFLQFQKTQKMTNGVIIHLDNDKETILDSSKHYFDQLELPYEYVCCSSVEEFRQTVSECRGRLKAVIFDLLEKEEQIGDYKQSPFNEAIISTFKEFNVPVFIYSGYLYGFDDFKYNGTVLKIDKGNSQSFKAVADKIILFHKSGFLDIFCPNGRMEKILNIDLHEAFVKQFNNADNIEKIIDSISINGESNIERVVEVFTRIAIKSLMSKLNAPKHDEHGNINITSVNYIEHYVKRISSFEFWTGDIFEKNDKSERILIITPRCNVASKGVELLLVCSIEAGFPPTNKEKIIAALNDNPNASGYSGRFLPPSPIFSGGKVDFIKIRTLAKADLSENYHIVCTLSDDLTNEILGKFGAYFLRTGIPPFNYDELKNYLDQKIRN